MTRLASLGSGGLTLVLLLAGCGGRTFESDSDTAGVEGAAGNTNGGDTADEPGTSDAPEDTSEPGSEPAADDSELDDAQSDDSVSPDPTGAPSDPAGPSCPRDCPVIAICQLCDDGSCATPEVNCNADGSCGEVTFDCPEPEPDPVDYEPCKGKVCGEVCDACAPGLQCLIGEGYCDDSGSCSPVEPQCEGDDPVDPVPGDCLCAVPDICQICESDGSCAQPVTECGADGECMFIEWVCPEPAGDECKTEADCASLEGCLTCNNGEEWCPHSVCRSGECGTSPNLCPESYEPCAGKDDGEACTHCSPLDHDCSETEEVKVCHEGRCDGLNAVAE